MDEHDVVAVNRRSGGLDRQADRTGFDGPERSRGPSGTTAPPLQP